MKIESFKLEYELGGFVLLTSKRKTTSRTISVPYELQKAKNSTGNSGLQFELISTFSLNVLVRCPLHFLDYNDVLSSGDVRK